MAENGRKWQKMGCRGYLVENGFWRFLRHSPTTICNNKWIKTIRFQDAVVCVSQKYG